MQEMAAFKREQWRPGRRRRRRRLAAGVALALGAAYGALLCRPQAVFACETRAGNLVLHSREPLPPEAVVIAEHARDRVGRSPFYDPRAQYDVFLCDTPLLFALFARQDYRAGGVAPGLTGNVFLRPAHVARDRLVGPSGAEASGDRTLTYFIAHEVTHVMVMRRLGLLRHWRLRRWQREGYADYVGKGGSFDYAAVLGELRAHATALDPERSGLYLRYHLLVAYLLDKKGVAPEHLLSAPVDPLPIESQLTK
jgi:hypothetical protein